ncbi:hypothetical protein [Neoaquamicrobium sediminum]|uniref:hypothetical protein n=1 Tax=Neoaquamicrobium sediminum TaxID=1849104 RepID=UPI0040369F3C
MAIGKLLEELFVLAQANESPHYARELRASIQGVHVETFAVTRIDGTAPDWVKSFLNKRLEERMVQTLQWLEDTARSLEKRHTVIVETDCGFAFVFKNAPINFDAEMAIQALCDFAEEVQQIRISTGEDAARRHYETGWAKHAEAVVAEFERQQDIAKRRILNGDGEVIPFPTSNNRAKRKKQVNGFVIPPLPPKPA